MIPASEVHDLPAPVRGAMAGLGFEYLTLRTFSAGPGTLGPADVPLPVSGVLA